MSLERVPLEALILTAGSISYIPGDSPLNDARPTIADAFLTLIEGPIIQVRLLCGGECFVQNACD